MFTYLLRIIMLLSWFHFASCYWDIASTTIKIPSSDTERRQSFFKWEPVTFQSFLGKLGSVGAAIGSYFGGGTDPPFDHVGNANRRRLCVFAGISIDFKCLSTAIILSRRTLVTAYNYLDPHMYRQHDLRIWALGRGGVNITPYRYRVLRVIKLIPKSLNPEHCHGPRCTHSPRHDVAIIFSLDQMYIFPTYPTRYHYAYVASVTGKYDTYPDKDIWFGGTAFEDLTHVYENYKIKHAFVQKSDIVDCSKYLPKWWGKFVCIKNTKGYSGIPNGGGLFGGGIKLYGIGCFEIRYNNHRIMAFTDLRYYRTVLDYHASYAWPGFYYEYAYPQWGMKLGNFYDGTPGVVNNPYIPGWQIQNTLWYPR